MTDLPRYFVFDVESFGLYGEDFAVAYTVVDRGGTELDAGLFNCDPEEASSIIVPAGSSLEIRKAWRERIKQDAEWVSANVLSHMPQASHITRQQMHLDFWNAWMRWRERGATMWADWGYPVEALFLRACISEDPARIEAAPCPLNEITTLSALAGTTGLPRKFEHLPAHDPLNDCRHSARELIEALNRLGL